MNSDRATCGGSAWSTQTVNDSMYACSVGERPNPLSLSAEVPFRWRVEDPLPSAFAVRRYAQSERNDPEI
jgi:hypothetical protein